MNDLDFILPQKLAPADYGIKSPVNAWPGAIDDVFINARWLPNGTLVQLGWDAGSTTVWQRLRTEDGTFGSWTLLVTDISPTLSGAVAHFADGAEAIALPDYHKLTFTDAQGIATVDAGDLRISEGGDLVIETRVYVAHNWSSSVIFGYAIDGGAPVEMGAVVVNSNDPVLVIHRATITLAADALLSLYISSNFEWSQFSWSGGEVLIINT